MGREGALQHRRCALELHWSLPPPPSASLILLVRSRFGSRWLQAVVNFSLPFGPGRPAPPCRVTARVRATVT